MTSTQPQEEQPEITLIPFEKLKKVRDLDKGGFGAVALYEYTTPEGQVENRAIKILHEYNEKVFNGEILPLLRLRHENIVRFFGQTEIAVFKALVLEFMEGGNLSDVIHHLTPYSYSLKDILSWNIQSARALEYMHSFNSTNDSSPRKFIHRDIKPQNLLLDKTYQTLKICDFGLSKEIDSSRNTRGKGTPLYMAPEVLQGERYNETCDVYSWTLTFWECLTEKIPFQECRNLTQLGERKKEENYLPKVKNATDKFNQIIRCCSSLHRQKRFPMRFLREVLENLLESLNKSKEEILNESKKKILKKKKEILNKIEEEILNESNEEIFDKIKEDILNESNEGILNKVKEILNKNQKEIFDKIEEILKEGNEEILNKVKKDILKESNAEILNKSFERILNKNIGLWNDARDQIGIDIYNDNIELN